jgi:hypothetical protein
MDGQLKDVASVIGYLYATPKKAYNYAYTHSQTEYLEISEK